MTLSKVILCIALATATPILAAVAFAQTSPSVAVADGQPWNATGPRGRAMTLTFYPDGKVRATTGIMRISMTWKPTDDGLCLSGGPDREKCITLVKTDTGYQGIENGKVTIQLSR
jgi:hypothetical protein